MNSQKVSLCLLVLAFLAAAVLADVYMHNPRGSNDRNCEKNENRNTGNRLFDSQNNAKGGYACPRGLKTDTPTMYYYQGSILPVQWTSQHSCGIDNNYCHIILQYMCSSENPTLRDGTPTEADPTATNRPDENTKDDANVGQHETFEYYKKCATRTRQNGLYIADQNIGTTSPATRTRQNPNGDRNGWECAEERDYYPYWHPTPWRDIAIFTNDMTQCEMYRSESQNVKDKGECWSIPADSTSASVYLSYNNYFDCVNSGKGEWKESGKFDIPAPQCLSTDLIAARDNHLGTTLSGKPAQYNWVLPFNIVSDACVLRIRYNISTDDVKFDLDYKSNAEESAIKQDPLGSYGMASTLSMAVNTNQFGRTFQDRSYVFAIKKREGISSSAKIYNVNVIGKRGNIVQTYPALEYRFVPEHLSISADDYVHFQWTGSDYNPNRNPNDGEGGPRDPDGGLRADRSNVVQMDYPGLSIPRPAQYNTMFVKSNGKPDMDLINKLAFIDQDITNATACYSQAQIEAELEKDKNFEFDIRNCAKLNGAKTPYFDAKPIKLRSTGTFWYFSTRNNNFSNRGQKASITVSGGQFSSANRMDSSIVVALVTLVLSVFFML